MALRNAFIRAEPLCRGPAVSTVREAAGRHPAVHRLLVHPAAPGELVRRNTPAQHGGPQPVIHPAIAGYGEGRFKPLPGRFVNPGRPRYVPLRSFDVPLRDVNWDPGQGRSPVEPAPSPLELIARRFPGWHIWRGTDSGGHPTGWHATRRERLTCAERAAGLLATVAVGDAGTLIERIEEQESLARGTELEDL